MEDTTNTTEGLNTSLLSSPASAPERSAPSNPQLSTLNAQPHFERSPGETPRAFNAFIAFFDLGHSRCLQAVADLLGEKLDTIKKWSSRFRWSDRIHSYNTGLLQQLATAQAAAHAEAAAEWEQRTSRYREREWETAEKLLQAVDCFLSDFSDHHVDKMTLAQVSRAFQIVSNITRSNLSNGRDSAAPALAPIQIELTAALKKAYSGQQMPNDAKPLPAPVVNPSTINSPPSTN
jgi:hypothetical protein